VDSHRTHHGEPHKRRSNLGGTQKQPGNSDEGILLLGSHCDDMIANEFSIWLDNGPVVSQGGSQEFNAWLDGAPVVELDEGGKGERRLVMIM
jgi:hypothetical protein